MILDIFTVLFLVSGFVLLLIMLAERRRDVLHGPYVTKPRDDLDDGRHGSETSREHPSESGDTDLRERQKGE